MRKCGEILGKFFNKDKIRSLDNKKTVLISVIAVLAALAALGAVAYNLTCGVRVEAADVVPENITSKISVTGTVSSGNAKAYYVFTPARVAALNVKVGDYVNEGDVLATFEADDINQNAAQLQYQWESAEAAFSKGSNAINVLKSTVAELDKDIKTLTKQLGSSAVSVGGTKLRAEFLAEAGKGNDADVLDELDSINGVDDSTKLLFSQLGSDTAGQVDRALSGTYGESDEDIKNAVNSALSNAEKKLETALASSNEKLRKQLQLLLLKQQRNILNAQVPSTDELRHLQAAAAAAKQAYEAVNSQAGALKNGWIADFSGVVSQVNVQEGGVVVTNTPGIVIVDPNAPIIDIDLGRYDAEKVKPGQHATVYVKDGKLSGTVVFVSPVAKGSGEEATLSCRVAVDNPDERMIIGFDVDVDIQTAEAKAAIVLPLTAVQTDELGKYCYKYNPEDRTAVKTYVGVGISNENGYQITQGITFGDKIILNPSEKLYDGVRVRICEPEHTTAPQSGLPTDLYTVPETTFNFSEEETDSDGFVEFPETSGQQDADLNV